MRHTVSAADLFSGLTWLFPPNSPMEITGLRLHPFAGALFKSVPLGSRSNIYERETVTKLSGYGFASRFVTPLPSSFNNISCYFLSDPRTGISLQLSFALTAPYRSLTVDR